VHRARKRFGQHFLHDPAIIQRILAAIDPQPGDRMVEIGPGLGAITLPLLARLPELHAIEIDRDAIRHLRELTADAPTLHIHAADVLEFDLASLRDARKLRLVGNLPYNISTPLLFHLLKEGDAIKDLHVMLQREVVERMTAPPGGKDYGRLTVMLALSARTEVCFDVGPGAFSPPPKVWSTVVRIVPREPDFVLADRERFARLVAHLFSMRRKTLGRALKGRVSPEQIAAAGLDPRARPETLAPADFATLAALDG
jgi:16S rRNA (adenine1518-N6/adenine1519-N6)-dimethyltransferase